jgi:hypothetical protein
LGWAYGSALASEPVQDVASQWLVDHLVPGDTIGIIGRPFIEDSPAVVHQDFFYKNTDFWKPRFKVKLIGYDASTLQRELPDYFVVSSKDGFGEKFSAVRAYPESRRLFLRNFIKHYALAAFFEKKPKLFGYHLKTEKNSDWNIPFPKIFVFKRK